MRRLLRPLVKIISIYAVLGFALIPGILHLLISLSAPSYLNQPLRLGGVFFNPFTLELRLESLMLGDPEQPVAGVKTLSIKPDWRSLARHTHIESIHLDAPFADVVLLDSGVLNIKSWTKQSNNSPDASQPVNDNSASFPLSINNISIHQGLFTFTDQLIETQTGHPFTLELSNLNASLNDFGWPESQGSFALHTDINNSASVNALGTVSLPALDIRAQIALDQLDLTYFQPYLGHHSHLDIHSGFLSITSDTSWSKSLGVDSNSQLQLDDIYLQDARNLLDVVRWNNLNLKEIHFNESNDELTIAELALYQPQLRVVIDENLNLNLASLIKPSEQTDAADKPASPKQSKIRFSLEDIRIHEGVIDFADRSFYPGFAAPISSLNGSITGLDSLGKKNLQMTLQGQVSEYSPVQIDAEFNFSSPLEKTSAHLRFDDIELTTLTPYSGRFAGYTVEKGRMDLALNYEINQSKLNASNAMLLDKLTLGERTESDEAIELPLRLAIALLKDRHGQIDIQLPVSGDLDNPEFELGPVLRMALTNMLTNIVAAPFNLLASLVGSDAETISTVYFHPGLSELSPAQRPALKKLAKALQERPELELEITGSATLNEDWPLVASEQLDQELRHEWSKQSRGAMSDDDRLMLLQKRAARMEMNDFDLLSAQELEKQLINNLPYNEGALRTLAINRSITVKQHLVESGLAPERIYIMDAETPETSNAEQGIQMSMELRAG